MCITVHTLVFIYRSVEQCDVRTQADMFLNCSSPLQQESEYKGVADSVKLAFHMNRFTFFILS